MDFIDDPILYSDDSNQDDWQDLIVQLDSRSQFWRRYAKRKMRRIAKELLRGIRPRIKMDAA
jgi:hypothetical protein